MQSPVAKRAAVYCRISETDQRVDKVERQRELCAKLAAQHGYQVVEHYSDDGISGFKDVTRPGYEQLITDARGGKFDVIVAFRQDRLSRDWFVTATLLKVCQDQGIAWHTALEGYNDLADGGAMLAILQGFQASTEQTKKVASIQAAFDKRRADGLPLWGPRPFAFEADRITHREDEKRELIWAYQQVLEGHSLRSIMGQWNDRGVRTALVRDLEEVPGRRDTWNRSQDGRESKGKPRIAEPVGWSYATVRQLLLRPRNAGLLQAGVGDNGEPRVIGKAAWDPIVDLDTWNKVRAVLRDPKRRTSTNRDPKYICAGIARCFCGEVMRSASGSDRSGSFKIYRCSSKADPKSKPGPKDATRHAAIKIADLDPFVRAEVARVLVHKALAAPEATLASETASSMRSLQVRLSEIAEARANMAELASLPGFSDIRTFSKKAHALAAEEQQIEEELSRLASSDAHLAMSLASHSALWRGVTPDPNSQFKGKSKGKRISFAAAAALRLELAERMGTLPVEQQRTLVREHLGITVHPLQRPQGRRASGEPRKRSIDRVEITHLSSAHLDDDYWSEGEGG